MPPISNQLPCAMLVTIAVCAGLLSSVVLMNLGGGIRFGASDGQLAAGVARNITQKLDRLWRVSSETLQVLQKVSTEQERSAALLGTSGLEVNQLQQELKKAKLRIVDLEREKSEAAEQAMTATELAAELEEENDRLAGDFQKVSQGGLLTPLTPRSIPRILHHMYLGNGGPPAKHRAWMESCKRQYTREAGWQYRYWTTADVEALIRRHRPEYMKTWNAFPKLVMKIDAGKYLIMQYVGGLYLDTDTECFREGGDMLDGYDLVVQQDYQGAAVNSGIIACKANHPVWDVAFEIMKEREGHDLKDTGHSTGPQIVRDMIQRWHNYTIGSKRLFPDTLSKDGSTTHIYPLGQWFTPCGYADKKCHMDVMLLRSAGQVDISKLVGFHRFTALWLGWKDGIHPQDKDAIRAEFCKDLNNTMG